MTNLNVSKVGNGFILSGTIVVNGTPTEITEVYTNLNPLIDRIKQILQQA